MMNNKKYKIVLNAPTTLAFTALCFIATLLGIITKGWLTGYMFSVYRTSFKDPLMYVRMFTYVLGHADMSHFVGNASFLLLLGPLLEEKYGSRNLIFVILTTALVTGIIFVLVLPSYPACGASGVVFAFILLSAFIGFRDHEIPLTFLLVSVLYLGQQIYDACMVHSFVSQIGHILGGITGTALGFVLNRSHKK